MQDIRRFSKLPADERWLLLRAAVLVAAARIALSILPFRWLRGLTGVKLAISPRLAGMPVQRLSWAVQAAARRIPRATCLTQALAMQRLLAQAGRRAELRIGVAKDATRGFEAHAWVEWQGNVVLGNNMELHRYAPMLTLRSDGI